MFNKDTINVGINNANLPENYFTQTTTWDEAFNSKITAKSRQNKATRK